MFPAAPSDYTASIRARSYPETDFISAPGYHVRDHTIEPHGREQSRQKTGAAGQCRHQAQQRLTQLLRENSELDVNRGTDL
jgi:hypothetical protein